MLFLDVTFGHVLDAIIDISVVKIHEKDVEGNVLLHEIWHLGRQKGEQNHSALNVNDMCGEVI